MKKLLLLCVVGLCVLPALGQSRLSQSELSNLKPDQRELYRRIVESDSIRELKVNNYLSFNPGSRVISSDDENFVLTDVVNGKAVYTTLDNSGAALATGTNHLQIGGSLGLDLTGEGMVIAVWDGGPIQTTHTEFQDDSGTTSRVINIEALNTEGTTSQDDHGTHVSGTIAARGVNPAARGMAVRSNLRTYNFLNDTPEMVVAVNNPIAPLIISNHSYGIPIQQANGLLDAWFMGAYTGGARELDDIARNNPQYLIVMSAGNSGNTFYSGGLAPGFDKLTGDKTAKNNLVVANANPTIDPFTSAVTLNINSSSSQGPTDDLRIKPDIAGDGTGLISPVSGDGYATFSGTSMAAPNVTGSIVLLQEYYNQLNGTFMTSAMARGLVCHTATDDDVFLGPDPFYGWGLLNAREAALAIEDNQLGTGLMQERKLNNNDTYSTNFVVQDGDNISVTISWTDLPGTTTVDEDLNNPEPRLVNDLDLRIVRDADGEEFFPWRLEINSASTGFSAVKADNFRDNIERIDIDNAEGGSYTLTVSHKGSIQSDDPFGVQSQDFALILTGSNVTLSDEVTRQIDESLLIYPNPAEDNVNIRFSLNSFEDTSIKLFDISGRLVLAKEYQSRGGIFNETIDLNNLNAGLYLVQIDQGRSKVTRKLIVN